MGMLIAWDGDHHVVAESGFPSLDGGIADVEAFELEGRSLKSVHLVGSAVGQGTWPEHLGPAVYAFDVEVRDGPKGGSPLITAIIHRTSHFVRRRSDIEAALAARLAAAGGPVYVDDLLGSPGRPLRLDDDGHTLPWEPPRDPLPEGLRTMGTRVPAQATEEPLEGFAAVIARHAERIDPEPSIVEQHLGPAAPPEGLAILPPTDDDGASREEPATPVISVDGLREHGLLP